MHTCHAVVYTPDHTYTYTQLEAGVLDKILIHFQVMQEALQDTAPCESTCSPTASSLRPLAEATAWHANATFSLRDLRKAGSA